MCVNPAHEQEGSIRDPATRQAIRDSGAKWVRIWADWSKINPARGVTDNNQVALLDDSIACAKQDGLGVILVLSSYPTWANGYDSLTPAQRAPDQGDKAPNARFPTDVSVGSDWYYWLNFLAYRYNRNATARFVDVVEIVNEPNLVLWPQRTQSTADAPNGNIYSSCVVASMMQTAKVVQDYYGGTPLMAGPAIDLNTGSSTRAKTNCIEFTDALLSILKNTPAITNKNFVWTLHNYQDVIYGTNYVASIGSMTRARAGAASRPALSTAPTTCGSLRAAATTTPSPLTRGSASLSGPCSRSSSASSSAPT